MDGDAFKAYTAEILLKQKAELFYLPAYSPDMSPVEMAFSKLKTTLRAEPARTIDTLWRGIGIILNSFTPKDRINYFQTAGYQHSM